MTRQNSGTESGEVSGAASQMVLHRAVTEPIRVTYRDTDRMGHVYHANYLVWFEIGRTELLRGLGAASYRDWEEKEGIFLPVLSCWADFRRAAQYDDLLVVETTVTNLSRAAITFEYVVRLVSAEPTPPLATGGTRHAFVDGDGRISRAGERLLPDLFRRKKEQP